MNKLVVAGFSLLMLGSAAALAQDSDADMKALEQYMQAAKGDLTAKRDSALKTLVQLDQEKSKAFWALVKSYDGEMAEQRKLRRSMLEDFFKVRDKLTVEKAEELADRALDLDTQRNEVRRKYFKRMAHEVSPIAAAQFLQLQGQFETMGDLKLAGAMPLAGS